MHRTNCCYIPIPVLGNRKLTPNRMGSQTITHQVDVVKVALSCTSADHLRDPTKTLSRRYAGGNSRESLLDRLKARTNIS